MQAEELKYLSHEAVIKKVAPLATLDNVVSGIPAAITLAQFIIESFWGRSPLASASNNCFGMKKNLSGNNWPGSTWTGKSMTWVSSEASSGETVRQPSEFRVYASVEDSIADHSAYLAGAMNGTDLRYKGLRWQLDYRTAAQIIKDGGYATAPDYVEVLCAMIERYNLTQYNVAKPPFLVRVTVPMVAARKGPGSEYPATVVVRGPNVFTITEVQGSYGRLKEQGGSTSTTQSGSAAIKTTRKTKGRCTIAPALFCACTESPCVAFCVFRIKLHPRRVYTLLRGCFFRWKNQGSRGGFESHTSKNFSACGSWVNVRLLRFWRSRPITSVSPMP